MDTTTDRMMVAWLAADAAAVDAADRGLAAAYVRQLAIVARMAWATWSAATMIGGGA